MLETEQSLFEAHRLEWAARFPGQYVLVKGSDLVGAFGTAEAALVQGVRMFGLESFLVRSVDEDEVTVSIPALVAGVLHADPTYATQG
ncbi:MAG: hypothetical protein HYU66_23015 [Armatimonadetes bacterium]|nr:hypothetical protein [Armatimonadota bacterium]